MLSLQIKLVRTDILTILSLSIHEYGVSIYLILFKFFSLEFFGFGHINFGVYFVKLVPKYLCFEGANVNGIVLLILNSTCSFTIGKQLTCVFIVYPAIIARIVIITYQFQEFFCC